MTLRPSDGPEAQGRVPVPPLSDQVMTLGSWASWTAFLSAVAYSVAQILSPPLLPVLPSPWSDLLILAPSLVLPLALLVALNCLHERTAARQRVWTRTGVSFAVVYLALVGFVYIIQLAVVVPARFAGAGAAVEELSLSAPWIQAVDGLGYALMSVAFLCAAGALRGGGERSARRWFLAHGALAPVVVAPLWVPPLIVVGTLWFITAPAALWQLTRLFRPPVPAGESSTRPSSVREPRGRNPVTGAEGGHDDRGGP
jgi:hypothetical protein